MATVSPAQHYRGDIVQPIGADHVLFVENHRYLVAPRRLVGQATLGRTVDVEVPARNERPLDRSSGPSLSR